MGREKQEMEWENLTSPFPAFPELVLILLCPFIASDMFGLNYSLTALNSTSLHAAEILGQSTPIIA